MIYYIALYVLIFTLGMLAGYMLKVVLGNWERMKGEERREEREERIDKRGGG